MASRTIVVGAGGSIDSEAAINWCIAYAPPLDARVLAVHALPPLAFMVPATVTGKGQWGDEEALRACARDALGAWCAPLRDAKVEHEALLVDGVVAEALMKVAADVGADLVVVGRRGHGGFSEFVLGSVSHTLSHRCDVPVVIVPADG